MYVHEKSATKASKEFYSSHDMHGVLYIFGQGKMLAGYAYKKSCAVIA